MVNKELAKYLDSPYLHPTLAQKLVAQMPNEAAKENFKYLLTSKDSNINYNIEETTFRKKPASKEKDVIINHYLQIIRILFLNKYIKLKDAYICIDIIRSYCGELKQGNYYKVIVDMKYSLCDTNKDPMRNYYIEPDEEYYYTCESKDDGYYIHFIEGFKKDCYSDLLESYIREEEFEKRHKRLFGKEIDIKNLKIGIIIAGIGASIFLLLIMKIFL